MRLLLLLVDDVAGIQIKFDHSFQESYVENMSLKWTIA